MGQRWTVKAMRLIDVDALPNGRVEWEDIVNAPTVDPVKHGRWIDDYREDEFPLFRKGCKCSACGFRTSYGKPKFCMNCGAQMDGESDE